MVPNSQWKVGEWKYEKGLGVVSIKVGKNHGFGRPFLEESKIHIPSASSLKNLMNKLKRGLVVNGLVFYGKKN